MLDREVEPTIYTAGGPSGVGARRGAPDHPSFDLARLIQPVTLESFKSEYWEKRPLIIARREPSYYERLLTLADVDHILAHSSIRSPEIRIVRNGQDTPLSHLTAEGANLSEGRLEALYQEYRDGSTIVLLFLQERWPSLKQLCRSIASELSAGVQVNVYLTPPGERALNTHYDTHDVFVLQTHGSKRWRIYDSPFPLPLPEQPYRARPNSEPGEPLSELTLEPGDVIYIPRGYLHDAASLESTSLHLTVGIKPVTWSSVLHDTIRWMTERDPALRESLPPGFAVNERLRRACETRLGELLASLGNQIERKSAIDDVMNRALLAVYPSLERHLLDLEDERSLSLVTSVRRRQDISWQLATDDEYVHLRFHGKVIRLPADLERELRFIAGAEQFTANDLPGELDPPSRLVLLRRLLREGFLTVVAP
jgi:ribosomal protein L16 Arg81 hydroxylase